MNIRCFIKDKKNFFVKSISIPPQPGIKIVKVNLLAILADPILNPDNLLCCIVKGEPGWGHR